MDYGGSSTCFSVNTPEGLLIIDAGTGIKSVDAASTPDDIFLLFTHYHIDHVNGLPVFAPLYYRSKKITLMGDPQRDDNWRDTVSNFMAKPYWPVGIGDTAAQLEMRDLDPGGELKLGDVSITWLPIPHPQGCLAFKIRAPKYTAVIATDVEFTDGNPTDSFIAFCQGTTHLIFDAHYTPEELSEHRGWGHSSWKIGCRVAKEIGAEQLILTHHSPERTDAEIQEIQRLARNEFSNTLAGACGMTIWPQT
jgi:phosphoribosyl 1,2-cyclic phosphodiesterase